MFHSAEWNIDFNPEGKRIAVVGTGASAVQFIPHLQKQATQLVLFQRTPAWVVPHPNRYLSSFETSLYRRFPIVQRALRWIIFWAREVFSGAFRHPWIMRRLEVLLRRQLKNRVQDPGLREKLTPNYTLGCKRILLSDDYWQALASSNVDVVTAGLREARETTVVADDGSVFEVDALIFATGFRVTDSPFYQRIFGRGQQTLADVWQGSPRAYLGSSVHGFPNLFFLLGPNTGLGHSSVVLMIEAQIDHVMKVLAQIREQAGAVFEVKQEAQDRFVQQVDRDLQTTVWNSGGCKSWYLDRTGRNSTIWPKSVVSFQKLLKAEGVDGYQAAPQEALK